MVPRDGQKCSQRPSQEEKEDNSRRSTSQVVMSPRDGQKCSWSSSQGEEGSKFQMVHKQTTLICLPNYMKELDLGSECKTDCSQIKNVFPLYIRIMDEVLNVRPAMISVLQPEV